MAKYCFKVYLSNGNSKMIVPSVLDEEHTELVDMDKFVYKFGSTLELQGVLASELGININEIDKIKIVQVRKNVEFSIISRNPYLESVLTSTKKKEVNGYQDYVMNTTVISCDNFDYIDMKKYLFENLEVDSQFFLKEIYQYNNEFAKLLYRYGSFYNQGLYSEEDAINIQLLKSKIELGLSIYKNYRGLCKARYEYENKRFYSKKKNDKNENKQSYIYREPQFREENFPQTPLYQFNQYINELGEEREEFLDIEEKESMEEYGKRR